MSAGERPFAGKTNPIQDHLASFDLGDTDHEILGPAQPIGANLAFRRRVFADGLRFATNLGRIGGLLLSGEDTELVEAIRIRGGRVWYCASAVVHHRIGGNRLTRKFYVQRHYWFGVSRSVMDRARGGLTYQLTRALGGALFLPVVHIPAWLWASVTGDAGGRLMSTCSLSKLVGYWRGLTVATAPLPESQQRVRRAHPKPASPAIAVAASGRGQP